MGWLDNWSKDDGIDLVLPTSDVLDLSRALVLCDGANKRHNLYGKILLERVYKGSRFSWQLIPDLNKGDVVSESTVVIKIYTDKEVQSWLGAEGYVVEIKPAILNSDQPRRSEILIYGATDRSVLFGVGRFLRELYLDYNISYSKPLTGICYLKTTHLKIVSNPSFRMRQHQVAYRPKTNSYDAFSPDMMRTEILDLALFGTNGIEVIPPGIDDAMQSPQFSVDWIQMLHIVSEWCDQLDINLSIWYPAYFVYDTEEGILRAKEHWKSIFSVLNRLDALFVPGGDPGGRPAGEFFQIVETQAKFLRENYFPRCEVWVSSQYGLSVSYDLGTDVWVPLKEELQWMNHLERPEVRSFLDGVVYGPWSVHPIDEFRALVPAYFPLRNYPDLCHVQTAELPMYGWDLSFATTNNRESINPRPREMMRIIDEQAPFTIGCGCYSEGINDDVNKYVWTALHWGGDIEGPLAKASSEEQLNAMLMQYASFLMEQSRNAAAMVEIIYGLERNWKGPAMANKSINDTMKKFLQVEEKCSPRHRKNWRFNMIQFRAKHDAFIRLRLYQEIQSEHKAMKALEASPDDAISPTRIRNALTMLAVPYEEPAMTTSSFQSPSNPDALNIVKLHETPTVTHLYGRLMALAALLFQQIGYQLSVGFGGQHRQRGAYMDLIWAPLGDIMYLNRVFSLMLMNQDDCSARDLAIRDRFLVSYRERHGLSELKVKWYASFGDPSRNETPGIFECPTQPIPVEQVVPPYRPLELGEDPSFFTRPLIEFLDCSNDQVLRDLHSGFIPRAWRSYLVPIWPRTAKFNLHYNLEKLNLDTSCEVFVRITYLGKDLNRHGGDWEELNREAMPVLLRCNGFLIHDYLDPPEITETRQFLVPSKALKRAQDVNNLILSFSPKWVDKTTFRCVPIPVAELWILQGGSKNKLMASL